MKNILKVTLLTLISIVAANSYSLEKYTTEDMYKETHQSRENAKKKAEKEERERKEGQKNQQKTFEEATRRFHKTGSLR